MPRLFVAVWPPGDVIDALASLPRPTIPGVRWTPPERLHVTLRFFGAADEGTVVDRLAGERFPPAGVHMGPGVELLGRGVLVVAARGLEDLAARVAAATAHIGQPPPDRPFHGHVTVARYKGKPPEGYAPQFQADFDATEIALVRSHPPGNYTNVATFALP
ncbi:MAG: RNA 2',3'-cyclic phosphodiesterase [bacterium]|nr:RNA 2',3'-cyclic phosphodiesterase [bacterium]